MDLTPYIDNLRQELLSAAESGEASALAERLAASVASATRMTILDVLSVAADEITRDLVPASVEVRLRGRNPYFVVTPPPADSEQDDSEGPAAGPAPGDASPPTSSGPEGPLTRVAFRPSEQLKQRIEAAAAEEGISVNAWLIRTTTAALEGDKGRRPARRGTGSSGRFVGWVG